MTTTTTTVKTVKHVASDVAYYLTQQIIGDRIAKLNGPIFTTSAISLFEMFLNGLPIDQRQHYNCHCCRRFVEKYGGLVTIDAQGKTHSILWDGEGVPEFFRPAFATMKYAVETAQVEGVFMNDQITWGVERTGEWTHFFGNPTIKVAGTKLLTAFQIAAEKGEDFKILSHGLSEYKIDAVRQAVRVLSADALDRSEKTLGVAKWMLELHEAIEATSKRYRKNLVWLAVAKAPPGFCHVRSTMISTLLDDIIAGLEYEDIAARWKKKMHPLQYQRPTAPPSEGAIKRANSIVQTLEASGSLARRFAKLEEVVAFWTPTIETPKTPMKSGGIFDHLRQKPAGIKDLNLPAVKMTWEKFVKDILPTARDIQFQTKSHGSYYGMVTAANKDAPPILQWDLEPRNPVSWFFFHNGSSSVQWSLVPATWTKVNAICHKPCHWYAKGNEFAHQGYAAFLVLQGCGLSKQHNSGGFFPETLRSEFHEIRSVMEAYSKTATIAGHLEGTANGYALQKGDTFNVTLKVNGTDTFILDRWE